MEAESLKIVLWEEQYLGEGLDTPSDESISVVISGFLRATLTSAAFEQ